MKWWHDFRVRFGLAAAFAISVFLLVHLTGRAKIDNAALGLIGGVVAALVFAFAGALGIRKLTIMKTTIEFAKEAATAIPTEQRGQVGAVLGLYAHLFPVLGARILWVDDKPWRLVAHRQLLRRLGVQLISVTSTAKAKEEVERDPDFVLVIQNALRGEGNLDAKELKRWVDDEGKKQFKLLAPLVVYSFDPFEPAVGVSEKNWITKDFGELLERILKEVRDWHLRTSNLTDYALKPF
jgi:hypothetical protein